MSKDRIIVVLNNLTDIKEFLQYKLSTKPTDLLIPKAILLKFKYQDPVFFTSFTNTKLIIPIHQTEFTKLLKEAINNYKKKNNIILTNRETHDLIQNKLRQKLAIDYLTNLNFRQKILIRHFK